MAGKVCVITGADSMNGIGHSGAFAFAREGATHIYLLDLEVDASAEIKVMLNRYYPATSVTVISADAADEATISNMCERVIQEQGRLDVFFSNAGISLAAPIPDISADRWLEVMRANTLSAFLAVKYAAPAMQRISTDKVDAGGSIILTAYTAGLASAEGDIAYSASKAAIIEIARLGANQLAANRVRVNSISTASTQTSSNGPSSILEIMQRDIADSHGISPIERLDFAVEITQVILFLASDDSLSINGRNVSTNGGAAASLPSY